MVVAASLTSSSCRHARPCRSMQPLPGGVPQLRHFQRPLAMVPVLHGLSARPHLWSQQQARHQRQQFTLQPAAAAAGLPTAYIAELPAELPPTISCSQGLEGLTDTQLAVQAADWGYTQLGRPFPEGVSMEALSNRVPDSLLQPDPRLAWGYLALSLGIMAVGAAWLWYNHSICPMWQRAVCWLLLGTGYFGVFQTACDCARFAFLAGSQRAADALGSLLMVPSLFSYETWRLKWFNHIQNVNMLGEDTDAWQPLTLQQLAGMPPWQQKLLELLSATPLRFFSSIGQWVAHFEYFDLKCHPRLSRPFVLMGWVLPVAFAALAWPSLLLAGGAEAWVNGWLMPWLVFHAWLSLTTLVHHTAPHIPWVEEGLQYDHGQATVNGTVTMRLPEWLEVALHHANYDLPKHITVGVPSYRCKAVFAYLQQRLGPYLTTADFNLKLVLHLMTAWLVYDTAARQYMNFDAAAERSGSSGSNPTTNGNGSSSSSSSGSTPLVDSSSADSSVQDVNGRSTGQQVSAAAGEQQQLPQGKRNGNHGSRKKQQQARSKQPRGQQLPDAAPT